MSRHRHMPPSNLKSDFEMEKKSHFGQPLRNVNF